MTEALIFYESGRPRKGERAQCATCAADFVRRASHSNGKKEFCSRKCSQLASRRRLVVECAQCSKVIEVSFNRIAKSKSGLVFCGKSCMVQAQRLLDGIPEIHPPQYGKGDTQYKKTAFRNLERKCADCGLAFLPLLTVHHIDGNRKNGSVSNLEILCHNHHMIRHMKLVDEVWVYSTKSLTPRDKLPLIRAQFSGLSFNGRTGPWHGSNEGSIPFSSTKTLQKV